jgi:hypothetical protein
MPGPSAEDIQRAFGGRVFGVVGQRGEGQGWGSGQGALQNLSLLFTVRGEPVEVETATDDPGEESPLVQLALRVLWSRPPLPFILTFEERAARLRVCEREHDFKSYACGDRSIAFARVGDLWVTVLLPTSFLDGHAFELHDKAEYRTNDQ